jgi:hypothetical protein
MQKKQPKQRISLIEGIIFGHQEIRLWLDGSRSRWYIMQSLEMNTIVFFHLFVCKNVDINYRTKYRYLPMSTLYCYCICNHSFLYIDIFDGVFKIMGIFRRQPSHANYHIWRFHDQFSISMATGHWERWILRALVNA